MGFVTRFLNRASQEIKVKLNESRLLKFYQFKQLKENSTENSAEKNFRQDSQFNEPWNISTKQKKKILKFKELYFPDTLSDKFQQIALKFATLYLFYLFLSCFLYIKFLFKKKLYCLCYLFESVSELKYCGTYCLNLPFEITVKYCTLKPPKNITQLNTKLGFSVTHFNKSYSIQIPLY